VRLPALAALSAGLIIGGCGGPETEDAEDIYELPETDTGWWDEGPLATDPDDSGFHEEGEACPAGVFECAWGLGCVNDRCGECGTADDCRSMQACVDGSCGACSSSDQCRGGETCIESFCLPAALPEWDLSIEPAHIELMDEDPWEDLWFPVVLTVDGLVYDGDVRARYLGGSTRSLPKKSWRIEFPEDADHPGFQRKINLRAEYNDPATRRNFVALETFRRLTRTPTPLARYVDFSLNGVKQGVMLEVERVGGKFLTRNGRSRLESMYEAERSHPYGAMVPLDSVEDYQDHYKKAAGADGDWSDLYELIEDVLWADFADGLVDGAFPIRTRAAIDEYAYARLLAVFALIQSQEHVTQNFYFSRQDRGDGLQWEFYPWDLDLSMGCLWDVENASPLCGEVVHDRWWLEGMVHEGLEAGSPNTCWCNMAIHHVVTDPLVAPAHRGYLCEFSESSWWTSRGPALVSALGTMLAPYVENDPTDRNEDLDAFFAAGAQIQDFMALRGAYLTEQLGCF